MKGLIITSLSFFLISIIFRLLHWPGASILALFSILLILVFAIINSIIKKKVWNIDIFGGWVIMSWALYILFKYLYWYAGPSINGYNSMFLFVLILTILFLTTLFINKRKTISKMVITIGVIGFIFSFIPSYSICYFFDLNEIINKENNRTNYYSWDKYSWFLYIHGEKKRALVANLKAIEAWENMDKLNGSPYSEFTDVPLIIIEHRRAIIDENWTDGYIRLQ